MPRDDPASLAASVALFSGETEPSGSHLVGHDRPIRDLHRGLLHELPGGLAPRLATQHEAFAAGDNMKLC
jgi:hypothetical protein